MRFEQAEPGWELPAFDVTTFAPRATRFAIGIPVIDEGERILRQLARMQALGLMQQADVVLADGGSTDGSMAPERLASLGVRALLTKRGPGRLSAQLRMFFAWGLTEKYDGFVIIDGNDKDGVEAIPAFLAALEAGFDHVQGSRYIPGGIEENTPASRKWAVRLLHAPVLSLAAGFRYTDTTNGFRAVSARLLRHPGLQPFRAVFDTYNLHYYIAMMAPRLGLGVTELPVARRYPPAGPTPSKIKGVRANLHILSLLASTVLGQYRPPRA